MVAIYKSILGRGVSNLFINKFKFDADKHPDAYMRITIYLALLFCFTAAIFCE